MDHHKENQTSTLLQKPQAIHFVEWCGKVFVGTLSGFILKVSINFQSQNIHSNNSRISKDSMRDSILWLAN